MSTAIWAEAIARPDRRARFLLVACAIALGGNALALVFAPSARKVAWDLGAASLLPVALWIAWFVPAAATISSVRRLRPTADPTLLPIAYLLAGWGILSISRVSAGFAIRQAVWLWLASLALLWVLHRPPDLGWLRRYRFLWLLVGMATIVLTLFLGTNPSGGEPHLWLGCCGVYFQPSEPLRLLLVAFLASFLGERLSGRWGTNPPKLGPALAPLVVVWGLSAILLLVQRDLGTGSLFLILLAVLLYLASGRKGVLLAAGALTLIAGVLGYAALGLVRLRVQTWLNPWVDSSGAAYQIVQAMIAYASGGVFGRGPGLGSPGFVPLAHSDLIFAVIVEETGLLGGLAVLGLLATIVQRGLRMALHRRSAFESMLVAGITLTIGLQSVLILGGVLRLLPLTGVTVPFLSYGGSSLVTSFLALGLLLTTREGAFGREALGPRLRQIQWGFAAVWAALAILLGVWTWLLAPQLTARQDNPRRPLAELYSRRGSIVDRGGNLLAETGGERGSFLRIYADPSSASVVGFDSRQHGQAGAEQVLDPWLRGEAGLSPVEIWISNLLRGAPPDGLDGQLTLDGPLQREAWQAMAGRPGAVVLLDAQTGEILALLSSPGFDANSIDGAWETLRERQDAPLLNRATQGMYQPGAALGPLFAAWGERLGAVSVDERVAGFTAPQLVEGHSLPCAFSPPAETEGTLAAALRFGCPTPLVTLGSDLGSARLEEAARAFGLGVSALIDLPSAPLQDLELIGASADPGLVALGQEDLTITPLQIARVFATLASHGRMPELSLVRNVERAGGGWEPWRTTAAPADVVSPEVAAAVLSAMQRGEGPDAGFGAYAIGGPAGDLLAWYVGVHPQGPRQMVGLVVLEGGTTQEAGEIALRVLGMDGPAAPP